MTPLSAALLEAFDRLEQEARRFPGEATAELALVSPGNLVVLRLSAALRIPPRPGMTGGVRWAVDRRVSRGELEAFHSGPLGRLLEEVAVIRLAVDSAIEHGIGTPTTGSTLSEASGTTEP